MNHLKTYLTAIVFSLAGATAHVNAAEQPCLDSGVCFQLTPLASDNALPALAEDGSRRTPQGMRLESDAPVLAANGFDRTPLGKWLKKRQQVQSA
jgi:hypothetical protein